MPRLIPLNETAFAVMLGAERGTWAASTMDRRI